MKAKKIFIRIQILSLLLLLLGFQSCDLIFGGGGSSTVDYNVPSATYRVRGVLVDAVNENQPLQNIHAVLVEVEKGVECVVGGDTLITGNSGIFELQLQSFPENKKTFRLKLIDVDSSRNEEYESSELDIVFINPKYVGGNGGWNQGVALQDVGDVKMILSKK